MTLPAPENGSQLLFVTDDAFLIRGRGIVLTPGIPRDFKPLPCTGAALFLRCPDGRCVQGVFLATEMISLARSTFVPILIGPASLSKAEVPAGTEVWILSQSS